MLMFASSCNRPLFPFSTVSSCLWFSCDLSFCQTYCLSFLSLCLCVHVAPVLTPPESEKADSEDRVSLKVCSQHPASYFSLYFSVKAALCQPTSNCSINLIIFVCVRQTPKRVEVHSIHTYVTLYKFLPQEKNDLELQSV